MARLLGDPFQEEGLYVINAWAQNMQRCDTLLGQCESLTATICGALRAGNEFPSSHARYEIRNRRTIKIELISEVGLADARVMLQHGKYRKLNARYFDRNLPVPQCVMQLLGSAQEVARMEIGSVVIHWILEKENKRRG